MMAVVQLITRLVNVGLSTRKIIIQVRPAATINTGPGGGGGPVDWNTLLNKPTTFPPSAHDHPISQVIGLPEALDAKTAPVWIDYDTYFGDFSEFLTGTLFFAVSDGTSFTVDQIVSPGVIQARAIIPILNDWAMIPGLPSEFPPSAHTHAISDVTGLQDELDAKQDALGFTPEDAAQKGVAGGYASLDGGGKVPAAQLPSFVDDVIEVANFAALPVTGEVGKIYVTLNDNKTFRWSGSAYVEISASPGSTDAVTEGSGNLYFTTARVLGTALTGFAASGTRTAVVAADTILAGFGKVQKYLNDLNNIAFSGSAADLTGTKTSSFISDFALAVAGLITGKQDTLVSGTNIKTVNGSSILGSGNLVVAGGGSSPSPILSWVI